MPRFFPLVIATLAGTAACSAVRASFVNSSFESGFVRSSPSYSDFVGEWDVADGWRGDGAPYEPVFGAPMRAGPAGITPWLAQITPSDGQWFGVLGGILISEETNLSAGQQILLDIGFAYWGASFDAVWYFTVSGPSGYSETRLTFAGLGATDGLINFSGWTTIALDVQETGSTGLVLDGVFVDGFGFGLIDNVRVVPAPGGAIMLVPGVLIAARRRR